MVELSSCVAVLCVYVKNRNGTISLLKSYKNLNKKNFSKIFVYNNANFRQNNLTIQSSKKSHKVTDIESNQKS